MNQFLLTEAGNLPEEKGIFSFLNRDNKTIFIAAAENIKQKVSEILSEKPTLREKAERVEIISSREKDLIKIYAQTIRQKKPVYNLDLSEQILYPFFKITREKYPRLLVTRKISNDNAGYFGAFLPETKARFLLDFLIKTFRLRSCAIEIDGRFPVPCTQFYEKKCVAPCVESVCDKAAYDKRVNLLRLFLANERDNFEKIVRQNIQSVSDNLDFETAARLRDFLQSVLAVWNSEVINLRLKDAVDTFEIEERGGQIFLFLVSQRGRKILGRRIFIFEKTDECSPPESLSQILWQIYEFYAPKEIRVSVDFADRKFLSEILSTRASRPIKINIIAKEATKKTTASAFERAKFEYNFFKIKLAPDLQQIQTELNKILGLSSKVKRIEAFDVAHISGTNFVAAKAVWNEGKFSADEYEIWLSDEKSELAALEQGIISRFESNKNLPDVVLIDGGKAQLSAALKVLGQSKSRKFRVVAVVKPPGRHKEVSHFIREDGKVVKMNAGFDALQILARLRDEAHNLSNRVHRLRRDSAHFYELANILPALNENERKKLLQEYGSLRKLKLADQESVAKVIGSAKGKVAFSNLQKARDTKIEPLIVPVRYTDEKGSAEDLQPLSMKNEIIFPNSSDRL